MIAAAQAQNLTARIADGKIANAKTLNSRNVTLVTDTPAFPPWHPNVIEIGSDMLIIGGSQDKAAPLGELASFTLSADRKSLLSPSGDRLTLLSAFDHMSRFARSGEGQVLLAQLEIAPSRQSLYFFFYRDPGGAVFADAARKTAMAGLPAFRLAVPSRRAKFDPLSLSFTSFDVFETGLRPISLAGRYTLPSAFHLVDPAKPDPQGLSLASRLATYEAAAKTERLEMARRAAEAEERRKQAAAAAEERRKREAEAKQAQARARQKARRVVDAFNTYFLRDCNNLMALARARNGNQVAGAVFNTIRPRGGYCTIDNFGVSIRIGVRSVSERGCDFTRAAGECVVTMGYSCTLRVKIGQQFDPFCPLLRIPFPVQVQFLNRGEALQVVSLKAN